jgi:hypothetical protein
VPGMDGRMVVTIAAGVILAGVVLAAFGRVLG